MQILSFVPNLGGVNLFQLRSQPGTGFLRDTSITSWYIAFQGEIIKQQQQIYVKKDNANNFSNICISGGDQNRFVATPPPLHPNETLSKDAKHQIELKLFDGYLSAL